MDNAKELRERLAALNRQPLPLTARPGDDVDGIRRKLRRNAELQALPPPLPIVYHRDLPRAEPAAKRLRIPPSEHVALDEAVAGTEALAPHGGRAYVIAQRRESEGDDRASLCAAFRDALVQADSALRQRLGPVCGPGDLRAEDVIFMDLESTGLAGTPLFLIGTMTWEDGFVVRQYLARDYSEEKAVISLFLADAARRKLLVTFNGKSFDVPYVRVRAAATGTPFEMRLAHFDLLHECRRAWGGVLPDCKLQTLERRICGRPRHADIPGEEIPAAYHCFVRTGNAAEMLEILRHNVLDLVTLAELMVRLPGPG